MSEKAPSPEKPESLGSEKGQDVVPSSYIKPQARKLHDTAVKMEEYHYYAQKTRELERSYDKPRLGFRELLLRKKPAHDVNSIDANFADPQTRARISDEEWTNASRAFRTASSGAAFYLITTDVLGPFFVPYSIATLGWGPGIGFYTLFGVLAGYSGYLIWRTFRGVDSYQFPARNYGDLAFRCWGPITRYITNIMQGLSLLLLLGQLSLQYGQNISQMSKFRLCYIVCPLLFVIGGFVVSQIRTLKSLGLIANLCIWLNLLAIFISMGIIAHSAPNYAISTIGSAGGTVDPTTITPDASGVYPAIIHYNGLPAGSLVGHINGLLSGVFAFAGAQLFVEFLAEMKRPNDFLKAMWGAQLFIYTVYVVYGCFVYYYQGQYSYTPSYQGISVYGWQTAANAITLLASLLAAALYSNIGIKVFYNNVLMELFKAPPLQTHGGKILYAIIVPIWWSIAFIIAAAIPDFNGIISVMSASLLVPLTFALPPFFALGYDVQRNATKEGEGFDPRTGEVYRSDSGVKRFVRGFMSGGPLQVVMNVWNTIYFLAGVSLVGLGMYAAITGLITAFKSDEVTSFSCRSPLDPSG